MKHEFMRRIHLLLAKSLPHPLARKDTFFSKTFPLQSTLSTHLFNGMKRFPALSCRVPILLWVKQFDADVFLAVILSFAKDLVPQRTVAVECFTIVQNDNKKSNIDNAAEILILRALKKCAALFS